MGILKYSSVITSGSTYLNLLPAVALKWDSLGHCSAGPEVIDFQEKNNDNIHQKWPLVGWD